MTHTREQVIEQTRIDFECYFLESRRSKGANRQPTFMRYEHDGTYIDDHTQRHWWTWQQAVMAGYSAGRLKGLEEVREGYTCTCGAPVHPGIPCEETYFAIEQLKEQK